MAGACAGFHGKSRQAKGRDKGHNIRHAQTIQGAVGLFSFPSDRYGFLDRLFAILISISRGQMGALAQKQSVHQKAH